MRSELSFAVPEDVNNRRTRTLLRVAAYSENLKSPLRRVYRPRPAPEFLDPGTKRRDHCTVEHDDFTCAEARSNCLTLKGMIYELFLELQINSRSPLIIVSTLPKRLPPVFSRKVPQESARANTTKVYALLRDYQIYPKTRCHANARFRQNDFVFVSRWELDPTVIPNAS